MNDEPHDPLADELDLSIAAYVDGVATPDERARVEADPELMAIVARHEEIKSILGDVPRVSETTRASIIAAALAAHTSADDPVDVRPLRTISAGRPQRRRLPPRWLGAAAAVIAAVGGLAVFARTVDQGSDDSATNDALSAAADTTTGQEESDVRPAGGGQPGPAPGETVAGSAGTVPVGTQASGTTTPVRSEATNEHLEDGPLARRLGDAGASRVCATASSREARFSFDARFRNTDEALTIEDVSMDSLNGLRLVGVVIDPSSTLSEESARGYPPLDIASTQWQRQTLAVADDVTIEPGEQVEFVLGFELEKRETGTARGVRIRYTQQGQTYEAVLDRSFAISNDCATLD